MIERRVVNGGSGGSGARRRPVGPGWHTFVTERQGRGRTYRVAADGTRELVASGSATRLRAAAGVVSSPRGRVADRSGGAAARVARFLGVAR